MAYHVMQQITFIQANFNINLIFIKSINLAYLFKCYQPQINRTQAYKVC